MAEIVNNFELERWLPMPPNMGPPLPKVLGIYWPWYKTAESIIKNAGMEPALFTATAAQLDMLVAAGYLVGSDEYRRAVDYAYDKAAADVKKHGGMVAWSAARGYYCTAIS